MAKCTLGGQVILGSAPARWTLREGSSPVIESLDLTPEGALAVIGSGPLTLVLNDVTVTNLWGIGEAPTESPYIWAVKVADRRWMWPYVHVCRSYNMRKRIGVKRAVAVDGVPEVNPLLDDVQFHAWSLNGGTPSIARRWTAVEALRDVLKDVLAGDLGPAPTVRIDLGDAKDVPIEDLEIDDAGDAAIDRILKYIPGARAWIDLDGTVVIDTKQSGAEVGMVDAMMPELTGKGHVVNVSNALLRPRKIHVLFTREIEVRFDFAEPATALGTTVSNGETRTSDNVLPVPDYQLPATKPTWCEGTWITFPQAMNAWGDLSTTFGQLNYDVLCKAMVPFMDLIAAIQHLGSLSDQADWGARIAAVQQHWRQTYRINPRWLARIASIRPYRVATLDTTLGSRAPAVVYCDYVAMGTQRLWLNNARDNKDFEYARNYAGYPTGANGYLDSSSRPAPAVVSIVDEDQGIIRLDLMVDPLRLTDRVLPGNIKDGTMPTARIDRAGRDFAPLTFDSVIRGTEADHIPQLKQEFKAAFILTCVAGAPNNNQRLQRVTVIPSDIGVKGACAGPEWYVRVGAGVETARFKWNDANSGVIERAFGVGNDLPADQAQKAFEELETLCVNLREGTQGAASLTSISQAVARRIYAQLADHYVGHASGILNAALKPAGWIAEIVHEVATTGEPTSRMTLPENLQPLNLFGYLDANTRATVMRLVK